MVQVYKILTEAEWAEAEAAGAITGSADDRRDGFIHLSLAAQVPRTVERHFAGVDLIVIAAMPSEQLGDALKFEAADSGESFPHHYGDIPVSALEWLGRVARRSNGTFTFPPLD